MRQWAIEGAGKSHSRVEQTQLVVILRRFGNSRNVEALRSVGRSDHWVTGNAESELQIGGNDLVQAKLTAKSVRPRPCVISAR